MPVGSSPLFWQYLLAAELPEARRRAILRSLGACRMDPVAFLFSPGGLSPSERANAGRADIRALEKAIEQGVVALEERAYPEHLRHAVGHPSALFCWGQTDALSKPLVGIVGTRGASTYGKAVARKFAESLARAGVVVVSGGALGIDCQAHEGALGAGGQTVAVLGNGVDKVHPSRHTELFARIRSSGCLVSQFSVGAPSLGHHFPARNHLIAGLSSAVLVVEAPERSGALITANAAAEMGRQVFVVPSTINHESFRGSHALIRDGATLVDHPDQILESLGMEPGPIESGFVAEELSTQQRQVLAAMSTIPATPEALVAATGLEPAVVLSELTMLELEGRVLRDSTGYALKP